MDNFIPTGRPYSLEVNQTFQCLKGVLKWYLLFLKTHFEATKTKPDFLHVSLFRELISLTSYDHPLPCAVLCGKWPIDQVWGQWEIPNLSFSTVLIF